MIPYYPADTDSTGNHYVIETIGEHLVAHYANMTLPAVDDLLLDDYLLLLRDAFIARKLRTPDGCEYLDNAWRLEQTEPDVDALRSNFGGREEGGDR